MGSLKTLAGQTALYGISSIVGRLLNYLLVPLHTAIFVPDEFGSITLLYSYVAVLNVLFTYGLETAYFRFSSKNKNEDYYNLICSSVLITGIIFSSLIFYLAPDISRALDQPGKTYVIQWLSVILLLDAFTAIPFAKLRIENRALKFVMAKAGNIVLIVLFNLFFLIFLKGIYEGKFLIFLQPLADKLYSPRLRIGYVFLANLIGSASLLLFLFPEIRKFKFKWDWAKLKPVLIYSLPIMVTGLAGMLNDNLDKMIMPIFLPDHFYPGQTPQAALGVYGAVFKLSVFMMLAVQAFRYAGEPFFFSHAEKEDSRLLYARVLKYFVIGASIIMVAVSLNADLIGYIFLRSSEFRIALYLLPYLLLGKLFFGIYINISIWYKLTDQTMYGVYFAVAGTFIIILGNILLLPLIGYDGSAYSMTACYFIMCLLAYYIGTKKYPIPYNIRLISAYIAISASLSIGSFYFKLQNFMADSLLNIALTFAFVGIVYLIERHYWSKSFIN